MILWLLLALLVILVISVGAILSLTAANPNLSVQPELVKSLLQLGVVSVVGSLVAILMFEYQHQRQLSDKQRDKEAHRIEYRESLLLSTLATALSGYSKAKKARRLLRARAITVQDGNKVVTAAPYDECIDQINDAQLELENLVRDVETSASAFTNATAVASELRLMEKHLNHLVKEYERLRPSFSKPDDRCQLADCPLLLDFVASADTSQFGPMVIDPYHKVQATIRADLLHPKLPTQREDSNIQRASAT